MEKCENFWFFRNNQRKVAMKYDYYKEHFSLHNIMMQSSSDESPRFQNHRVRKGLRKGLMILGLNFWFYTMRFTCQYSVYWIKPHQVNRFILQNKNFLTVICLYELWQNTIIWNCDNKLLVKLEQKPVFSRSEKFYFKPWQLFQKLVVLSYCDSMYLTDVASVLGSVFS